MTLRGRPEHILLIGWLAGFFLAREHADCELLELGALAVSSLLPIYHRFYDASLLVLPLCWAFVSLRKTGGRTRKVAAAALLLMTPFLIPGRHHIGDSARKWPLPCFAPRIAHGGRRS